ncbi:MAG: GNAT family N-acetyltransferase [Clostridia bacterium]|nr:GNAT family N-acetyltransferase [Clostridia bacterium]
MTEIKLIKPTLQYADDIMSFRNELISAGEEGGFDGCSGLQNYTSAEEWLKYLATMENEETCPEGRTPSDAYIAVRTTDNRIVGIIDLRRHINHPILSLWGGHMGYTVRPSERNKGYAKEILRLNLYNCRDRGIGKILLTCNKNNIASEKVIIANGGVFEKEVIVDNEHIKRFWITV